MATRVVDMRAQKERRQKIILVVGGVIFLALAAIQGPKVLDQLNGSKPPASSAPATETTPAPASTPAPGVTTPSATPSTPTARKAGSAVLAGVTVAPSEGPEAAPDQLWSFSRFAPNDPFEQNVVEEQPGVAAAPKAEAPKAQPGLEATPGAPGAIVVGSPGVVPAPGAEAVKLTDATISVNGKPQQLKLKETFPKADKTFVLVALTKVGAKIGVAGGAFTDAKTITLKPGRQLTLVDTTTGARYVVKLLYAGAGPEQVAQFTSKSG
jgi:hypothetical protein